MTVEFSEFLPEVLPFAPGVAEPVAENAIRQACIEFCERTDYWTETLDPMPSIDGVARYDIFPPNNYSRIHNVLRVSYNDKELTPKTPTELDLLLYNWETTESTPSYYYVDRDKDIKIVLAYVPDTTANDYIDIRVSLKPKVSGDRVADEIYLDWRKSVSYGALAFLFRIPNKPWSDEGKGMMYYRQFNASVVDANRRARKAFTYREEFIPMRPWK